LKAHLVSAYPKEHRPMQTRNLGREGLTVSALGLGCMGMTGMYGTPEKGEAIATLHRAIELGVTFLDTAEAYGPYENEKLLGEAIKGKRDKVVIATKFGFKFDPKLNPPLAGVDSRPANVKAVADASLKRLGIDHIDLFYQHRVDPQVPIEDVVGAMADLVKAGKVRYLGLSEAGAKTIRRAHKTHPISALQSEYSIWERNVEDDILPVLRELGIGFVPFSPLGRGFLTGTAKRAEEYPESDYRHREPRLTGENYDANMRLVEAVKAIADEKSATPGQIALAWLLAQGPDIVPIPGTKRRSYLEENAKAAAIKLSKQDLSRINAAAPPGATAGPRYTERMMSLVDR
jgi:aryl-alcohol dehydrogenase-like predicted oxidoreductase